MEEDEDEEEEEEKEEGGEEGQEEDDSEGEVSKEEGEEQGPPSNDDVQQLEENLSRVIEALSKSAERSNKAWATLVLHYRRLYTERDQSPPEGSFAVWAVDHIRHHLHDAYLKNQWQQHWENAERRVKKRAHKIVGAFALGSIWRLFLFLGPLVIDAWEINQSWSYNTLRGFGKQHADPAFKTIVYAAIISNCETPPIHALKRSKPRLESDQVTLGILQLLENTQDPPDEAIEASGPQHGGGNATPDAGDQKEYGHAQEDNDPVPVQDSFEVHADQDKNSVALPSPFPPPMAIEDASSAEHIKIEDLAFHDDNTGPERPPAHMAGIKQVNSPGADVHNVIFSEVHIQEVAQRKRLTRTTVVTYIKNVIVPMLTTESLVIKSIDYIETAQRRFQEIASRRLAIPEHGHIGTRNTATFRVRTKDLEKDLDVEQLVAVYSKITSVPDDTRWVAIPCHDAGAEHWFMIGVRLIDKAKPFLGDVTFIIEVAIWDSHPTATLAAHEKRVASLLFDTFCAIRGRLDTSAELEFRISLRTNRLVQEDACGLYLLDNLIGFTEDPMAFWYNPLSQVKVERLRELVHGALEHYWQGVQLLEAHVALRVSVTCAKRDMMAREVDAEADGNGDKDDPADLAISQYRKRRAQEDMDERDTKIRRKQDALETLHRMQKLAELGTQED